MINFNRLKIFAFNLYTESNRNGTGAISLSEQYLLTKIVFIRYNKKKKHVQQIAEIEGGKMHCETSIIHIQHVSIELHSFIRIIRLVCLCVFFFFFNLNNP